MKTKVYRNEDISRVLIGAPNSHKHLRTIIETPHERFIFQEATIANIVRAYITIKTRPTHFGIELITATKAEKEGYAQFQLLESGKTSKQVQNEITQLASYHAY
jgi:hypothetical protein